MDMALLENKFMKLNEKEIETLQSLPEELFIMDASFPHHGSYSVVDEKGEGISGVVFANTILGYLVVYDKENYAEKAVKWGTIPVKLIQGINFRIVREHPEIKFIPQKINEDYIGIYHSYISRSKFKNLKIKDFTND